MRSTTKRPELRRAAVAGGGIAAVSIVLLASQAGGGDEPAAPPAPPPAPQDVAVPAAPTPEPPSAAGLKLYGLLGRGAIIAQPDGQQRFFAIGREVAPGLRVARIERQGVILASAGGELRLGFDGAAPSRTDAGSASSAAAPTDPSPRDETLRYRLGLQPRRAGVRTAGFVVRPGVEMPALARAGLRPGDVILAVNGSGFDEERMLELAWEIANTRETQFLVERDGRRMNLALRQP